MYSVVDLRGAARGTLDPPRVQIQFLAVIGKIWQNRMWVSPPGGWRPHLGEILDPPLVLTASSTDLILQGISIDSIR